MFITNPTGRDLELFAAGESYVIPPGVSDLRPHRQGAIDAGGREIPTVVSEDTLVSLACGRYVAAGVHASTAAEIAEAEKPAAKPKPAARKK